MDFTQLIIPVTNAKVHVSPAVRLLALLASPMPLDITRHVSLIAKRQIFRLQLEVIAQVVQKFHIAKVAKQEFLIILFALFVSILLSYSMAVV